MRQVFVRVLIALGILVVAIPINPVHAQLHANAKAAIIMDASTGMVLYSHQADTKLPPASTTKIITTLLGLEFAQTNENVIISPHAASIGESSIYLSPGERFTMEELLFGALLKSGNDACVAIGEQVAGTEATFVHMMNLKAKLLGAYQSQFRNTNGLPNKEHLMSARDLAVITRYALMEPEFAQIVKTKEKVIGATQRGGQRFLKNTNKLLWQYPWAIGVKTGTTRAAGQCLVAAGEKDGHCVIIVLLNSPARFSEAKVMLEQAFQKYTLVTLGEEGQYVDQIAVDEGEKMRLPVVLQQDAKVTIERKVVDNIQKDVILNQGLVAPVHVGQVVGKLIIRSEGNVLNSVNLVAAENCARRKGISKWPQKLKEILAFNS